MSVGKASIKRALGAKETKETVAPVTPAPVAEKPAKKAPAAKKTAPKKPAAKKTAPKKPAVKKTAAPKATAVKAEEKVFDKVTLGGELPYYLL